MLPRNKSCVFMEKNLFVSVIVLILVCQRALVARLGGHGEDVGQNGTRACQARGYGALVVAKGCTCGCSLSRRRCRPANQRSSLALVLLLCRHVLLSFNFPVILGP